MNLENLTDDQLLTGAKKWADLERAGLHGVLHHIHEIDRRRLYASLKYPSLFAYVVGELKYAEDAAVRRISAMRMMKALPEIEAKITEGKLNLTNLGLASRLFRNKAHTKAQKMALLSKIENKSSREARQIVCEILPDLKRREIGYHDFDDALKAKLEEVRGMLAHSEGELSLTKLLHKLCDEKIAQKSARKPTGLRSKLSAAPRMNRYMGFRDEGCVNCGSRHALEVDHIVPRALGGTDASENLRLLCRSCNQRAAIIELGGKFMQRYLKSPGVDYGGYAGATYSLYKSPAPNERRSHLKHGRRALSLRQPRQRAL